MYFCKLKISFIFTFIDENYSKELNDLTNSIFKTVPNEIQGLGLSFGYFSLCLFIFDREFWFNRQWL